LVPNRGGMVHMESYLKVILRNQLLVFMVNKELEPLCSKYLQLGHTVNSQLLEATANHREASRITVTCNKESKDILSSSLSDQQLGITSRESLVTCILRSQLLALEPMANNKE